MATPLMGEESWQGFLRHRKELTARMDLTVCDGCDGCGGRCIDGFEVSRQEWETVKSYLADQPESEVRRVREQKKTLFWPGAEEFGLTVTYCRFRDLERGECSVYPARPTVCRLFGQVHWLPCPIEAVEPVPDGSKLWGDYRRFERKTWRAWEEEDRAAANEAGRQTVLP